jgi:hypothetical protein
VNIRITANGGWRGEFLKPRTAARKEVETVRRARPQIAASIYKQWFGETARITNFGADYPPRTVQETRQTARSRRPHHATRIAHNSRNGPAGESTCRVVRGDATAMDDANTAAEVPDPK